MLVGSLLSLSQYYCLYKGPSERLSVTVNVLSFFVFLYLKQSIHYHNEFNNPQSMCYVYGMPVMNIIVHK